MRVFLVFDTMSGSSSKLIRKIALLSKKTDTYIKSEVKKMAPLTRKTYLRFMKENIRRIEELKKNPPITNKSNTIEPNQPPIK